MRRKLATRFGFTTAGLEAAGRGAVREEQGQGMVLFVLGLIGMIAIIGLSVDVGRVVWARTQMQAAVDASGLAAAQSMPDVAAATTTATSYWNANNGFIVAQGHNVQYAISFPNNGNRRIAIHGEADIDTWFTRIIGFNSWHVSADSQAESQVLDITLVLDISGSMCWGSYPPIDKTATPTYGDMVGPGNSAYTVTVQKKPADPAGSPAIYAGGPASITMYVSSTAIFNDAVKANNNAVFGNNSTTKYYQWTPGNSRTGMIQVDSEVFKITAILSATTMTVTRAQPNTWLGSTPPAVAHAVGTKVWAYHSTCQLSSPSAANGPWQNYDDTVADAQFFTTLFNPNYDQIGLAQFSSAGHWLQNLTETYSLLTNSMAAMGGPNGGTNTAHGIALGRMVLDGPNARAGSNRVLVLETDGNANSYCGSPYSAANYNSAASCPNPGSGNDGDPNAVNSALQEAARVAADNNTRIYVIGLGPLVNDAFLQNIATIGNGAYYKAPTTADLSAAFQAIAAQTHIKLVQ